MTPSIPAGSASHTIADPRPGPARTITVHTHRPGGYDADAPIVMVMHGRARNGADYRDYFVPDAGRRGFLVVAPEFSEAQYPHPHAYNYGNMCDAQERILPREEWLFAAMQAVFDDVRARAGSRRDRFFLFGHSAGSQLVHRMATFGWIDSIEHAVAANAGSYTLPSRGEPFPYGLDGLAVSDGELRRLFSRPVTVLLGDRDIGTADENLPRGPGALRQGPHRFARGHHYFETAKREAARLGVPLAWRLVTVPGVAHSGELMAPAACRELFG